MPDFRFVYPNFAENKSKQILKPPFEALSKIRGQIWKVCGERSWIPISEIVWNFTIGSAVWVLDLCEVAGKNIYGVLVESGSPVIFFLPHQPPPHPPMIFI